jgi:hypothetical protein
VKLSFLDPLYSTPGPLAGVYLDTSRDIDDPDRAIELRWRHLREELAAQGADNVTVSALASAVGTNRQVSGRHGRALFASQGRLVLAEELPEPPVRDTALFGEIPDAMPLAVQHAPDLPYVAVTMNRQGLQEPDAKAGRQGADEMVALFQAGRWPMSRVAPQPLHQRGFPTQHGHDGAAGLAKELADLVHRSGAEVIVLGTEPEEPWARGALVNRLPQSLRDRIIMVACGGGQPEPEAGRALLEEGLDKVLSGRLNARDRMHADMYQAQRARHPAASDGMAAAVAALQRGQAQALLLNRPAEPSPRLWSGTNPTQISQTPGDLRAFGAPSVREEPAESALIRAVVDTGAEVIVVPREDLPMDQGVGVLLRYPPDTPP